MMPPSNLIHGSEIVTPVATDCYPFLAFQRIDEGLKRISLCPWRKRGEEHGGQVRDIGMVTCVRNPDLRLPALYRLGG
jgi:hypothetical protein